MDLDIHSVNQGRFPDLARLMEARGGPDWCWCMAWRAKPASVTRAKGSEGKALRKALLAARVERGEHIGLLAYHQGRPVGWCSTGPLSSFVRLGGPKDVDPEGTWAISCFFIAAGFRKQGLTRALTRAAIETARRKGATMFQVTGVAPTSPSYKFMGLVAMYRSLGFEEVALAGSRRHVMRLPL